MWPIIGGTENYKLSWLPVIMVFMVIYIFAYTTLKYSTLLWFSYFGITVIMVISFYLSKILILWLSRLSWLLYITLIYLFGYLGYQIN